jgi:hypothetical protein
MTVSRVTIVAVAVTAMSRLGVSVTVLGVAVAVAVAVQTGGVRGAGLRRSRAATVRVRTHEAAPLASASGHTKCSPGGRWQTRPIRRERKRRARAPPIWRAPGRRTLLGSDVPPAHEQRGARETNMNLTMDRAQTMLTSGLE